MNLLLYDRPARSIAFWANITHLIGTSWTRKTRAIGGYYTGSFVIDSALVNRIQLMELYDRWIGAEIKEKKFGLTTFQGIVWQLDLVLDGVNFRRTLDPRYWHNRVKVIYSSDIGEREIIAWSANADSIDEYGEMEYVVSLAGSTSAAATAKRDRELTAYAWPSSRQVGGADVGASARTSLQDGLYVKVVGSGATMNWRHRETSETAGASVLITTLIGETEFIAAGRIEINALSVRVDAFPIPQRIGDLILGMQGIVAQGDNSGNVWKGGVYADRKFIYEQAPVVVNYFLRDGILYDKTDMSAVPELLEPGFLVRNANAPSKGQPGGSSNVWDDPQVAYCDEVEFQAPDILRLRFPEEEETVEVLTQQILAGTM